MDDYLQSSSHCKHLRNPNPYTVSLAAFLVLGIVLSYLPQHRKIISRRSSEGLSPWWVLLGGLSSIAAIGNILTLPASRSDLACCKEISGRDCAAALLGVGQIGLQWSCFMFVVLLFLIFFPAEPDSDLTISASSLTRSAPPKRRDAVLVGVSTLLALLVVGIASVAITAVYPHHTQTWANILGAVAGTLAMVQYVPQIYFTWRLGEIKSLSMITMLIQVPGAFLFALSLWLRVGWEGWSTWLVYVVTGVLQGMLLGLAITYYLADRQAQHEIDDTDETTTTNERTALIADGRKSKSRPIRGTQTNQPGQRQLSQLYAATPPEHDSDRSSSSG